MLECLGVVVVVGKGLCHFLDYLCLVLCKGFTFLFSYQYVASCFCLDIVTRVVYVFVS